MPNRFSDAVAFFNIRRYYDAHEAWEDVWRESSGPERRWLQGLVQTAVALHHASNDNRLGARSVLRRAANNLSDCPENEWGIDIAQLRADVARNYSELQNGASLTPFRIGPSTGNRAPDR